MHIKDGKTSTEKHLKYTKKKQKKKKIKTVTVKDNLYF